ncbi:MAG: ribosome small subunit-dependent GTPase A [Burkholderiales bacterium PBB4]|nr:MAG: ribosome small subunit-dependent GTPase A [Burkholderiales bacterium PBB4]
MIHFAIENLQALGLTSAIIQQLASYCPPTGQEPTLARVTEVHRETVTVNEGTRECVAHCPPRLQRALQEADDTLAVGDWVLTIRDATGHCALVARLAPYSTLERRDADGRRHTLVTNVDTAFLVMGLDGDFNPQRLERFLALAQGRALLPVVVLTKADCAKDTASIDSTVERLRARIGTHIDVLCVDGRSPDTERLLAPYLGRGHTVVMLGSSGAGKSTLTNTLLGYQQQDTGAVRDHDSRGKHTTTSRSLHRLARGACIIDTPGVRTLNPGVDATTLDEVFNDISRLALQCRFRDCHHAEEPGCAVRAAILPQRLKNYQKLLRESRRDQLTVLDRQAQLTAWKIRTKAARSKNRQRQGWDE